MKLSEKLHPNEHADKVAALEALNAELAEAVGRLTAENKALREGIIRALQIPIGAVLDQHTRFALTDALKEVDDETE